MGQQHSPCPLLSLPPRRRWFSCPVATSAAARPAASSCARVPCAARTSPSASASSTVARRGEEGQAAPRRHHHPFLFGAASVLDRHSPSMTSTALPVHAPGWLRPGASVSPMVPSGCSASAWGSCSICAPSSRLPARRPLAGEHWVLELGARGARPARWMSFPSAMPPEAAVAVQLPCCGGALPGSCLELCCPGVGDGAQRRSGRGPCLAPMHATGLGLLRCCRTGWEQGWGCSRRQPGPGQSEELPAPRFLPLWGGEPATAPAPGLEGPTQARGPQWAPSSDTQPLGAEGAAAARRVRQRAGGLGPVQLGSPSSLISNELSRFQLLPWKSKPRR